MAIKTTDIMINTTLDQVAEKTALAGNVHIRRLLAQTLKQSINAINPNGNASPNQKGCTDHAAYTAHSHSDYSDHKDYSDHADHNDYSDYEDFWNPGSCSSVTW